MREAIAGIVVMLAAAGAYGGPVPPAHNEKDLTAEELARPVVVYNRAYTGAIFGDYVPDRGEVARSFAPALARNEYEPMQVGLYVPTGKEALRDVTLEVTCDIPCRVGHIYYTPANELSWTADTDEATLKASVPYSVVGRWPVDVKKLVNKRASLPMYVLPVAQIAEIKPGRSGAFWVTFKTDEKIPSGTHKGSFRVSARGKTLAMAPFAVKVYAITLPRPKVHYGMYYLPYQTPAEFQGREFQRMYLADMTAHGMNLNMLDVQVDVLAQEGYDTESSTPVGPPEDNAWESIATRLYLDNYFGPEDYEADGGYNALKLADIQVRRGLEAGLIQRDHPCLTAQNGFNIQNKAAALAKMRRCAQAWGWPHLMQYMRDEPGPDVWAEVNENVPEWRRLGVTPITAMRGMEAFGVGSVHSAWTVLAGHVTPELVREAGRSGAEVWTYDCYLRGTNAEAGRFNAGLYTWSLGLAGNTPYAYMGEPKKQPHFDADWKLSAPTDDMCTSPFVLRGYVAPSPAGPVPGVGWEGRREGVDDVRYLQLLEARVKAAPPDNATAREAREWLENLRVRSQTKDFHPSWHNVWGADFMDPHKGLEPDDYDSIRAKAAELIEALPAAAGELNPEPDAWLRVEAKPLEADAFAKASVAECVTALKSHNVKERRGSAGALATRQGSEVAPAREALIALLDDPEVRMPALRALATLGPEAAPAVPALRKLLADEDVFLRMGATHVLTRIGREAQEALEVAAKDPESGVEAFAHDALAKLAKQREEETAAKDLWADLWPANEEVMTLPEGAWRFKTDPDAVSMKEKWYAKDYDDSRWKAIKVGEFWERQGYKDFDGIAWYRRKLTLPAELAGKRIIFAFGAADENALVFIDGEEAGQYDIGSGGWDKRFELDLTEHVKPGVEQTYAIRVIDSVGGGGLWKPIKVITPRAAGKAGASR